LRSRTTRRFRKAYSRLPEHVRERAQEAYRRFVDNPDHPGLQFKQVHSTQPVYSVRITRGYRALGIREGDTIVWFWIGSHADYDNLVSRA
jgi:mRNA-degrading endonuclease RelE of RelBE toxin-antitoxin system